jgi:hypothetical protein
MARKSYRRHRRGGANNLAPNPSSYSSAAGYGMAVNGLGDTQIKNALMTDGTNGKSPSITSVGVQGQNIGLSNQVYKTGGSRGKMSRRKRGGLWGQVINQAVVPLSILGMQQTYGRKRRGGKKTRRHSRRRHH